MPAPIKLAEHLTTDQLKSKFYNCPRAQEKTRWHALYLISRGEKRGDVLHRLARSSAWIADLVKRYNQHGEKAVVNQKIGRVASSRRVSAELAVELEATLQKPAMDGGVWSSPKVAAWIQTKTGQQTHSTTALRTMRRLGFTLQRPRPQHNKRASAEEQEGWKKNCS